MIGKENIEEKIFEYFEGDLSAAEAKDLENFVQANQEYQKDFDAWKNSSVEAEPVQYKHMEDLLVNEKTSPVGWFKWASGGAFMLLLSFASFGIFQKMNSNNISQVASIQQDDRDEVLDIKTGVASLVNNSEISNTGTNTITNTGTSINDVSVGKSVIVEKVNNSNKHSFENSSASVNNIGSVTSERITKNIVKKRNGTKSNDLVFKSVSEIEIDNNGLNDMIASQLEAVNKVKFEYEDPNKKKEYPVLLNLEDPYLNYNLAHTLEENGSFAGSTDGVRGEFLYRTEWPSVTSESYESQIGSVDWYSKALKGGIGVIVNRDMIGHGKLSSLSASLLYAPKFIIKGISLIPSFKYTFNNKSINWDQVKTNDIKDPRNGVLYASIPLLPEGVSTSNFIYHDFGFGMLVNTKKFYAGFQYDHVNAPSYKEDFFDQKITIPGKYSVQFGTDIKRSKDSKFVFSPSLNYVSYGNYNALWTNGQVSYNGFMLVAGAATNSDLMFSAGYTNAKVRLVYGLGFSKPGIFSGLEPGNYYESHQLSLRVNLSPKKR
tara:strand:- start:290 stop:1927 length:1638 start_codon:yes stop_codon:yes gene_type:complete